MLHTKPKLTVDCGGVYFYYHDVVRLFGSDAKEFIIGLDECFLCCDGRIYCLQQIKYA
jgi:hypothetical protein